MFEVKRSHIHGRGVFATKHIRKGTRIGKYVGPETQSDGAYVLWVPGRDGTTIGIKGKNALRFVNHSRKPNAAFYEVELIALRSIGAGEEITFDYGLDWRDVS